MAREYLKGSFFDRDEWQTKVTTNRITAKERFFGHILGPGMVYAFFSVVLALRELYYMDILRINEVFNNNYTYLYMTTVTTFVGIASGLLLNHMAEKTVCRAGRFRPYVLMGSWIMAIFGFFLFWSPFAAGSTAQLIWLYVANIGYNCFGIQMWGFRTQMVSVTSRNVLERNSLTTTRSAVTVMMAGMIVALGITGALYPAVLQRDLSGKSWLITIGIFAVLALGFSFMEYFWTRERVTEDNQGMLADESGAATVTVPFIQQVKNALTNKYFLLATLAVIGFTLYDYIQGGNARVNMITYILGGTAENGMQMLYLIASMQPMAIGAVLIPILSRKFGSRSIMFVSSIITLVGIGIAMINPYSFGIAVGGGFVFACGIFALTNMVNIFMQQASDDIEYKHGYRPEGTLATGIIMTLITSLMSPLNAIYETGLSVNGYVAGAMEQNAAVNKWILFAYYGAYAIYAVIIFVVCIFFDAEKKMPMIHEELRARAKKAAEDRGEVYISPEEAERLELEAAAKEIEENRIADLREECARKGLDFDTENQKYLDKQAKKAAKRKQKV